SRGLGRRPLTAVTRVRIPYAVPNGAGRRCGAPALSRFGPLPARRQSKEPRRRGSPGFGTVGLGVPRYFAFVTRPDVSMRALSFLAIPFVLLGGCRSSEHVRPGPEAASAA